MDGFSCPEGMSADQYAEALRIYEVTEKSSREELWRMACLIAGKKNEELLGKTEFQLRDHVHRIGAKTLEAGINERRKKGVSR